jgi:hypothetical protein
VTKANVNEESRVRLQWCSLSLTINAIGLSGIGCRQVKTCHFRKGGEAYDPSFEENALSGEVQWYVSSFAINKTP